MIKRGKDHNKASQVEMTGKTDLSLPRQGLGKLILLFSKRYCKVTR